MVELGMQPDLRDPEGLTPLMRGARAGKIECVRVLLSAGADPAAISAAGECALDLARARKRRAVVALLEAWPSNSA